MYLPTLSVLRDKLSFGLQKKQLFFFFSSVVTFLFFSSCFFKGPTRLVIIAVAAIISFLGVKFVLGLGFGLYWLVIAFFPTIFTLSTGLIHYYFPNTLLWFRAAFAIFFLFFFYVLLLSLNIFKVSRDRGEDIPLLRPAKTTLFLNTIVISFFSFTVFLKGFELFPLQLSFVVIFSFLFSFSLFYLTRGLGKSVILGAGLVSFVCLQVFFSFAFVPVEQFFRGLIISAAFYVGVSIEREYFEHKLNQRLVLEYLFLLVALGVSVYVFSSG